MKPDIHPKYYPNARMVCACGNMWTTGATLPEIHLDLCSNCHPFYTGEQRIVDTAGRVDRFKMRLAQKREVVKKDKSRKEKFIVVEDEPLKALETVATVEAKPAAQLIVPGRSAMKAVVEPEFKKRTLVESETGLKPVEDDDESEERKRRSNARKAVRATTDEA